MKTITSRKELLKKLQKNNLLTDGNIFYLSNFHKNKVGQSISMKLINERFVQSCNDLGAWFEKEWKLRKKVGDHLGVEIFKDDQRNQFFFRVKKGTYDIDTYELCINKLNYLKALKEPLK